MNKTVLEFSVSGQTMTQVDGTKIVRDMSRDYLRLKFDFDETWDGMIKTVYFQTADSAYPQLMETNEVDVPDYYAQLESFLITVVGINGSTAVATNVLSIALDAAGSIWVKVPSEPPTPVYQELVNLAESAAQAANESADALASISTELDSIGQYVDTLSRAMVRKVNNVIPGLDGNVTVSAEHITTQQEEWPYQGTVDDALDELCAMIKLRITEKRAQEIVTAALAEYALKSYVDDKNGELSASMANLAGQTQERIAEIARTTSEQIGDLSKLSTQAKSNLVAALNEVAGRPSGSVNSVNSVNGINPDSEGNVALNATKIPADGSTGSQSIAEALESGLADKQNKITAKGLLQGDGNGNVSGTKYIDLNKDGEISNTKTVGFYFESDGEDRGFYICAEEPDADKLIATAAIYGNAGDEPVRLKNIATPKDASDAANKGYVDSAITAALAAVPFAEEVVFGG